MKKVFIKRFIYGLISVLIISSLSYFSFKIFPIAKEDVFIMQIVLGFFNIILLCLIIILMYLIGSIIEIFIKK